MRSHRIRTSSVIAGLGAWVLAGSVSNAAAPTQVVIDEVIATVNNEIILKSEYEQEMALLEQRFDEAGLQGAERERVRQETRPDLLRDLIDQSLIRQKAEEYGIDVELDVLREMHRLREEYDFEELEELDAAIIAQGESPEDYRDLFRTRFYSEALLGQEVYSRMTVTTEEAREVYDANPDAFDSPAGVRLQEIVIERVPGDPELDAEARARAEEALERIRGGEDFASVAGEVSESTTREYGGDLGFFETGELSSFYEDASSGLARNQVSEILDADSVYVIMKVQDRHQGGILPFELAIQQIQNQIFNERANDAVREYLDRLREEGFIDLEEGYVDTGSREDGGGGVRRAARPVP